MWHARHAILIIIIDKHRYALTRIDRTHTVSDNGARVDMINACKKFWLVTNNSSET